jgi:glutamine synthetase type III
MLSIPKIYGELVFSDTELKKRIPAATYEQFKKSLKDDQKEILNIDIANKIAKAMKE